MPAPALGPAATPPGIATVSRRRFVQAAGGATVSGGLLAGLGLPRVHAAGSDEIRLALVGCGGRGGGAAGDALAAPGVNMRLYAMADVFPDRPEIVKRSLREKFADRIDVPTERTFSGFEAYKQAIDALRPGDIAICATPPAFRAAHFAHAIEKGVHIFMEKPVSVDGPSSKRILELAPRADAKGLKVAVGLMCRHCDRRRELFDRLRAGEAGELISFQGYREHPPVQDLDLAPGVIFSDYYVHHVDEASWMKDAWPISAQATGGRHFQGKLNDQNFDSYAVEWEFADGAKFFYSGRAMKGCRAQFSLHGQGSKGAFTISAKGHTPARCAIYRGQRRTDDALVWSASQPEPNPYRREWEHFLEAIVSGLPYNESVRAAEASLVTAMGRFAAHTGRPVTYQEMLDCPDDLTAGVAALTDASAAPLPADADGRYPVPMPGKFRYEFRS
jgi:predicted dehydrogenase